MSYTPFNAPLLSGFLGDMEIAGHFSVKAELGAMVRFEAVLAEAEAEIGLIPTEAAAAICDTCAAFEPDLKSLNAGAVQDGMIVPDFVRQLREAVGQPHSNHVHFGSTSQDVIDTSLVLRLRDVNSVLNARMNSIIHALENAIDQFGQNGLPGRTRMQIALPVNVEHRLGQWLYPLIDCRERLNDLEPRLLKIQLGGPVGTLDKFRAKGDDVRRLVSEKLDLQDPGRSWHTDRSSLVDYVNWLSLVCGLLGKMGQDIVLMAQNEITEITFADGGGSSAMAHKQNPVKAESLVAFSRFAATLAGGMHHALVHEQERSGAMWTFEWMVIPQLCVATGAALRNAGGLIGSITTIGASKG